MRTADEIAVASQVVKHLPELELEFLRRSQYKINKYFQEEGPYRRALYPKYLDWFKAGVIHRERGIVAANRAGKSDTGSYETTLHLTGEYPDWWEGRRFTTPIQGWAAGTTNDKAKSIIQGKLLGPDDKRGTGMIPARAIHHTTSKGSSGMVDFIWVRHKPTGGLSSIQIKSYQEGRTGFEGTEQHLIWLDEEPPEDIYTECLLRTMATGDFTGGLIMVTFTPLEGQTKVVNRFVPNGVFPANGIVVDDTKTEVAA